MDEKAALRRIFDAQSVWLNKAKEEHRLKEAHSAAKKEMDEANAGLCAIIEEYRTGQEQLPFEGAGGKVADDAKMDYPGYDATNPGNVPAGRKKKGRKMQ